MMSHDPDLWPIFVLSLEGDEARRAPLLASLDEMGLEAEVLIGVDGRGGLPGWAEAEVDRKVRWSWDNRPGHYLTDGELACALSHVRAYRTIIDRGLRGAVIFEDDAIIGEPFKQFVTQLGYEAGDIVLLGHKKTWVCHFSKKRLCEGVYGHRLVSSPALAHGYSLSSKSALHLAEKATPIHARADWPCDISRLRAFAAIPQLAVQPEDRTITSTLEVDRRAAHARKLEQKRLSPDIAKRHWIAALRKGFSMHKFRRVFGRRIA